MLKAGISKTDDTTQDARFDGDPHQGLMLCYHGVPMLDSKHEVCGTLCHFDLLPREIEDSEFDLLMRAGRVLPDFVKGLQRPDFDAPENHAGGGTRSPGS